MKDHFDELTAIHADLKRSLADAMYESTDYESEDLDFSLEELRQVEGRLSRLLATLQNERRADVLVYDADNDNDETNLA